MKLSPVKTSIILAVWVLLMAGAFWLYQRDADNKPKDLSGIYDYLRQANRMLISKVNFNPEINQFKSYTLLDSSEPDDVASFMDFLENELASNQVETSMEHMEVFTPDYKVELACTHFAVIEFVFYMDNNAAVLRNQDHFFFVELTPSSATSLKGYFDQLP